MPSLKDLRDRKKSVESTRKITSAMKMVAAAKLKRAQDQAVTARPYATAMATMLFNLIDEVKGSGTTPKLMTGSGTDEVTLVVVLSSDRGLCGGFNNSLIKEVRLFINSKLSAGKKIKILCVGRKGRDLLRRDYGRFIIDTLTELNKPRPSFDGATSIQNKILSLFSEGAFDQCVMVYAQFKSAMVQVPTLRSLIPFAPPSTSEIPPIESPQALKALYIYEPDEEEVLEALLPKNLAVQIYLALLETFASEQGARMTAMDAATRNASDMIRQLDLTYNRARQAYITKELIEIISGAEAL